MDIRFGPTIRFCFWLWLAPLFIPAAAVAELYYTNSYGIWGFATNSDTITITSHTGTNTEVVIPDSIDALPVTSIGEGVFFSESGAALTNIIIPDSVTNIGYIAFYECSSLVNVTLGNRVIDIGGFAFSGCTNLTSVIIPESVVTIGNDAFNTCLGLTNVTIGPKVATIGDSAFNSCVSLQSVTIPMGVTNISFYAFINCTNLTNVTVDPLNSAYSSVDGVLFDKNQKRLVLQQCIWLLQPPHERRCG